MLGHNKSTWEGFCFCLVFFIQHLTCFLLSSLLSPGFLLLTLVSTAVLKPLPPLPSHHQDLSKKGLELCMDFCALLIFARASACPGGGLRKDRTQQCFLVLPVMNVLVLDFLILRHTSASGPSFPLVCM